MNPRTKQFSFGVNMSNPEPDVERHGASPSKEVLSDPCEMGAPRPEGEVELSVVLPALNEELNIGECVAWCMEGFAKAGVIGEVLIVDSSSDRTAEIAWAGGARVIRTPKRGLGQAYIDAMPFIRGKYVLLGDCDCTYDFRELKPFLEKMREGFEFVMGSRFRGSIEAGAMPPHHQYFGTPLTTWILNRMFSSRFSDIHCGMRGISLAAFKRLKLVSNSWEYASEMVIKSVHMGLRTAEVPVHFYKDRHGRQSHHLRTGWWSPWYAGWINLKNMFIYGADFFLIKPGLVFLALGLALTVPLAFGPITIGPITLSLFWMLLGWTSAVLGLQCLFIGILGRIFFDYEGAAARYWARFFEYNRMSLISASCFAIGMVVEIRFLMAYLKGEFLLSIASQRTLAHGAVFGLFLMVLGFMLFAFMLILNSYRLSIKSRVHEEGKRL